MTLVFFLFLFLLDRPRPRFAMPTDTRAVWRTPRAGQETYRKGPNVLTAVNKTTVTPITFTVTRISYRASRCRVSYVCPERMYMKLLQCCGVIRIRERPIPMNFVGIPILGVFP
jgi:hypothetical protein